MKIPHIRTLLVVPAAAAAVAGGALSTAPAAVAARLHAPVRAHVLFVSAHAKKKDRRCTKAAPCRTIAQAMRLARRASEVLVERGTYKEEVVVSKMVALVGSGSPVIDAEGLANGITAAGAGAARALIHGFVVENANEEGILDNGADYLTIAKNVVRDNDRGAALKPATGKCAPEGEVPGDCGEALHLIGASHVTVEGNSVTGNSGGIYLTDETGPSAHNLIAHNRVTKNYADCGITLAGHNTKAVVLATTPGPPTVASLAPTVGGVYDNTVRDNVVDGNGVKGLGAGIGLFGGSPGTAVYNNTIEANTAEGNGLGGVTLHSHAPGQDLSGNEITRNILSDDGIAGNPGGTPGDVDAGLTESAGIIIFSADTKLTGMTIEHNQISDEDIGIWTKNAPVIVPATNTFTSTVKTDVVQK
ncbi:MAG: right-handed parallel beta-helix repeat-containing protein [Solirubrobacteraceae bacterium]